jgi:hypothetical protein
MDGERCDYLIYLDFRGLLDFWKGNRISLVLRGNNIGILMIFETTNCNVKKEFV